MKDKKEKNRPPVVVVLGHVDHGKSSLLEAIKDIKITAKEEGGITQHVGAYVVDHEGKKITFIDTPGHEAFSSIRSRGAKVADIGILVIAADEGVKTQTKEAISHLQKAEMPFLVVINKIDKRSADTKKAKEELAQEGVFVEDFGGEIPSVDISAKEKRGITELLEMVLLLAEMAQLENKPDILARGVVIETEMDRRKGISTTLLVKNGTLVKGDMVATESTLGRIKSMEDFMGKPIEKAGPSVPAQITGLKENPYAGEEFTACGSLEEAKNIISRKNKKKRELMPEGDKETFDIILKADVSGSLEAIESCCMQIPQEKIIIRIIRAEIGEVNESDIELSKTTKAKIFAFRVKTDKAAEKMSLRENIEVKRFDIIYELLQEIRTLAENLLGTETIREEIAKAKILAVFRTQKNRQILGGKMQKGEARKGSLAEIWRQGEKIGEGKVIGLRKEEKEMERIAEKEEFGMLFEGKVRTEEGDIAIFYKEEVVKKTLE